MTDEYDGRTVVQDSDWLVPDPSVEGAAAANASSVGGVNVEIDGYDTFSELGRGGFATVYRARQTALRRLVAIKVLDRGGNDDAQLAAFRRESHLVGDLSWHPHIANILAAGATIVPERRPFLSFELVEFGSLGDELARNGHINWVHAVRCAIEVADALAAAHDSGIIHRDVKADNVLIDRLGRSQVADFGIASLVGEDRSGQGTALTVAYAPPELIQGGEPSAASDIYSLGATLYEMIAGAPPFSAGANTAIAVMFERILEQPAPRLDEHVAPSAVADVVATALRKDPHRRYPSADDFGRALQQAQAAAGFALTPMPYCDRARPLARPVMSSAAVETPSAPGRPSAGRVKAWVALVAMAVGIAAGIAGGIVLADHYANSTDDASTGARVIPVGAQLVVPTGVSSTAASGPLQLQNGTEVTFSPTGAADNDPNTAWLVAGDGVGESLTFDLGGEFQLRRVGLLPGLSGIEAAAGADRFASVRRVQTVRWHFDDGSTVEQRLDDLDQLQTVAVDVTTRTARLEVVASSDAPLDFVAISETSFDTVP